MKLIFFSLFLLWGSLLQAQHRLEKLWESDTTLAIPESVLPDTKNNLLYVSLIDGSPWEADGKGGIAKLDKEGKIINAAWVTGLNAPKGMGLYNGKLYVADISDVVVIDAATGKTEQKIAIDSAQGLNDITIDEGGVVYVSDSKTGKVYQVTNHKPALFMDNLKGVNGLKSMGKDLYALTANDVYKISGNRNKQTVTVMEMGGDGIEPVGNGEYIVSAWPGVIYYMDKDGKMQTLLDTREQKRNTADIGYDPAQRIVYVPTFMAKSVVAFRLQ